MRRSFPYSSKTRPTENKGLGRSGGPGHPHLVGPAPGTLLLTYATNSWEFSDLLTQQGERQVYWPRFVALRLP